MRGFTTIALLVTMGLLSQNPAKAAGTGDYGPKPLTAIPDASKPSETKPVNPNMLPQDYVDLRKKLQVQFNDWMTDSQAVQKECDAARTPIEHAQCDLKKRVSQARLDRIHAETRDVMHKIDTWRRAQAGLPPRAWGPPPQQQAGSSAPTPYYGSAPKPQPSVLLPQSGTKLPAGTF